MKVCVVGLGLMGASICRAWQATGELATGYDTNTESRSFVKARSWAEVHESLESAIEGAELVILAVPIGAYETVLSDLNSFWNPSAVLTDIGSVKVKPAEQFGGLVNVRWVPAHPIAGLESHGPANSRADLFEGRTCVITPQGDDPDALALVERYWTLIGMKTVVMEPAEHDRILAFTSHLPHVLSFAMAGTSASYPRAANLSAGSFRDFTRIAQSDPVIWTDIFLANREPILAALALLATQMESLRKPIEEDDRESLLPAIERCRSAFLALSESE